jgi:hypothetical protein
MTYLPAKETLDGQAKVIYRSKDGRTSKTFEALDWSRPRAAGCKHSLQLVTHIPNKGEQMVRYYGYYSNKSRGMRKKAGSDDQVPALAESAVSSVVFHRNWARLIQKIYQIDPLFAILGCVKSNFLLPESKMFFNRRGRIAGFVRMLANLII